MTKNHKPCNIEKTQQEDPQQELRLKNTDNTSELKKVQSCSLETFYSMIYTPYHPVDLSKFRSATELREYRLNDMPEVSKAKLFIIKTTIFPNEYDEEIEEALELHKKKQVVIVQNAKRSHIKPGTILYKGAHLFVLIGKSVNLKYLMLLTENENEVLTFELIRRFDDKKDFEKEIFVKMVTEITDRFANFDEYGRVRYKGKLNENVLIKRE